MVSRSEIATHGPACWLVSALLGAVCACAVERRLPPLPEDATAPDTSEDRAPSGSGGAGVDADSDSIRRDGGDSAVDDSAIKESGNCSGLICDAGCVPNDIHNCGRCGHDCTLLSHVSGSVTCESGRCTFPDSSCASQWAHCNPDPDDGCETDISKTNNCGAC